MKADTARRCQVALVSLAFTLGIIDEKFWPLDGPFFGDWVEHVTILPAMLLVMVATWVLGGVGR